MIIRYRAVFTCVVVVAATSSARCSRSQRYGTMATMPGRDTVAAQRENTAGLAAVEESDFTLAEKHFRSAIEHDLYYAPAHNNLGLALLECGRFYEAAWEFERAAKLAPNSPEPRANLGLLYESVGRLAAAAAEYDAALALDAQHLTAMRHLARTYVKSDRRDDKLQSILERILLQPPDNPQWDVWARGQLIRLGRPDLGDSESQPFPEK